MSISINEDEIGVVEKKSPLSTNNLWAGRNRLFLTIYNIRILPVKT